MNNCDFHIILALFFVSCREASSHPQPTSLPTSLFVAPSIPEDVSSQLIDQSASPTTDSRNEEFSMRSKISEEDEYATTSEYFIGLFGIFIAGMIGYFVWKRYEDSFISLL